MSIPRYMLTLSVFPDMKATIKLKTPLGNIEGLKEELKTIDIEKLAQILHKKYGGIEKMNERWEEYYSKLFK